MKYKKKNTTRKFVEKFNFVTNIIILLILVFGGIGYSVGFHFPYEILPGQFANGNYSFNGDVDVNGSLRGIVTYSYGTSISGTTTSTSSVIINNLNTTINVKKDDLVKVILTCNLLNDATGTEYIWPALTSGNATTISSALFGVASGNGWSSVTNSGLYKANSDTSLVFNAYWYVSTSMGRYYYCKIFAYVLGKA